MPKDYIIVKGAREHNLKSIDVKIPRDKITVITGLSPGVVASLIDLEFDQGDVPTAVDLEEGFNVLEPFTGQNELPEESGADAEDDQHCR